MDRDRLEIEKQAIITNRRCQRNWDTTREIPRHHIEHWQYLLLNSPSKQDEIRFGAVIITNKELIHKINKEYSWGFRRHGNDARRNNQMDGSCVIIFGRVSPTDFEGDYEGVVRGEMLSREYEERNLKHQEREMGIAMGIIAFSAACMGYKTGFNTNLYYNAKGEQEWKELLGVHETNPDFRPCVGIGIGYPDESLKWYETRDNEYLEADLRETDLEYKTMLEDYPGIVKKFDEPILNYGPLSHHHDTLQPKQRPSLVKIIS